MSALLRLVLSTLALLIALGHSSQAQAQGGFVIRIGPGHNDFPLALPDAQAADGAEASAKTLLEVIRRDLEMTGYFKLIDPAATIDQGGVEPGTFKFNDWRVLKASAVAKTRVTVVGGKVQADVYLYDVNSGQKLQGMRYTGRPDTARYLGHRIAEAILETLTGKKGFFGARIAAVGAARGNKEIYIMDIDGFGVRPVTRNGSINLSPAWNPKGTEIAWTSFKRQNPDIYVKDLRSGRTRVLSAKQGINIGAAYSPDGTKVALTRTTQGDSDVFVIDARTGKQLQRVTKGGGIDVAPSFSPDGTKLVFSSERSGGSQIFIANLASGDTRRVSRQGTFNTDPVWSPDGTRVAFVGRDPSFDVFVHTLASGRTVRITEHMGNNEDPSWSPDGDYLVFSSTRDGRSEIWLSTADGRHQVAVTPGKGGWSQPTWSPTMR